MNEISEVEMAKRAKEEARRFAVNNFYASAAIENLQRGDINEALVNAILAVAIEVNQVAYIQANRP